MSMQKVRGQRLRSQRSKQFLSQFGLFRTIIIIIMSVFYSANFNSDKVPCSKMLMISDRHQTEAVKNTHKMMLKDVSSHYEYAALNRCVFRLLLKVSMDWAHLMEMGSVFQREGAAGSKQRLPKPSMR